MRIGIIGKGGSGKTSLTWMLAQALLQNDQKLCLIDADYNQHLAAMFGVQNREIMPLFECKAELVRHAIGSRNDITMEDFRKDTTPVEQSGRFDLFNPGTVPEPCVIALNSHISLARVGDYRSEDQGEKCYHYHTGAVDILLNHHVPLAQDQHILIDYTAGIDPAVSRLSQIIDVLVLAVEPTLKGVQVVHQWQTLLAQSEIPLIVVGNKVTGNDDAVWLASALSPKECKMFLEHEPALQFIERGNMQEWGQLKASNKRELQKLVEKLHEKSTHIGHLSFGPEAVFAEY